MSNLVMFGALAGAVLLLGVAIAFFWRLRRPRGARGSAASQGMMPVPASSGDYVVLSYDKYWEPIIAGKVKSWLEGRFRGASIQQAPFDTESSASDPEMLANAAAAKEFVALVCSHYPTSKLARQLIAARASRPDATRLLLIEAEAQEILSERQSDAPWNDAMRLGQIAILYDESNPGHMKQGAALEAELAKAFGSTPPQIRFDYFISYNREWSEIADHIETFVRNRTPNVFRDKSRLQPGVELESELPQLAASSRHFVAIISKTYLAAKFCEAELRGFVESLRPGDGRRIIPLLVEPIRPTLETMESDAWKAVRRALSVELYDAASKTPMSANEIRTRIVDELGKGDIPLSLMDVFEAKFDESVVPHVLHFQGREKDIDELAEFLELPERADDGPQARKAKGQPQLRALIEAGPGFGKTSLAAAFARMRRSNFLGVWWIRSETRNTILQDVQRISQGEAAPATPEEALSMTIERASALIAERFSNPEFPYLLVFDNVQAETARIVDQLASAASPNVRILMTARGRLGIGEAHRVLKLDTLSPEEATELLLVLAGSRDREGAGRLARDLGYLPLALRHAGRVCQYRTFEAYRGALTTWLRKEVRTGSEAMHVYGTIRASLAQAEQTSPAALAIMDLLTYCAADRIPISLLDSCFEDPVQTSEALIALEDVGLIQGKGEFDGDGPPDRWISVHRLVQQLLRDDVDAQGRSSAVIARLMPALCNLLIGEHSDVSERADTVSTQRTFGRYFPHFLAALPHLNAPDFRGSETGAPLDEVAKLINLKLDQDVREGLDIAADEEAWRNLPALFGCFYEVDPLEHVLNYLVERLAPRPAAWREFRDMCLAQNNYVLRFGLAEALGRAVENNILPIEELTGLLKPNRKLDMVELGGYALKGLASRRPEFAHEHRAWLLMLARHECYPGRSILGDLLLNLVYRGETPSELVPVEAAPEFWSPIWRFVEYDVRAIQAAELDRQNIAPDAAEADVRAELEGLKRLKSWRSEALAQVQAFPHLAYVVDNALTIGSQTDKIEDAREEIVAISGSDLILTVTRLLFGHPLWSVAERMASVLADLHEKNPGSARYRELIMRMFEEPDWRVRYGAVEAAFQIRQTDKNAAFFEAVDRFHDDPNKKLVGLCAENLFAIMLNQSDTERERLQRLFEPKIRHWIADDDCWVLEHVYRYVHTMHGRLQTAANGAAGRPPFVDGQTSPLLAGLPEWWTCEREVFLRHIDRAKLAARGNGG